MEYAWAHIFHITIRHQWAILHLTGTPIIIATYLSWYKSLTCCQARILAVNYSSYYFVSTQANSVSIQPITVNIITYLFKRTTFITSACKATWISHNYLSLNSKYFCIMFGICFWLPVHRSPGDQVGFKPVAV
jgi:hypothetical protein